MGDSRSSDRRQGIRSSGCRPIKPIDETIHFPRDSCRWWRFKVDRRSIHAPGDYLHWLQVCAITTDVLQVFPTPGQHPMPAEKGFVLKRFPKRCVEIDHHFRDPLFGRGDAAGIALQAELAAK